MTTWSTGQQWRVVNSLNKLNEQIRAYAPRAVPPATDVDAWGALADDAHSTSSDHFPHFYAELGPVAVVCARDFPHAPGLGLDGGVVTEHLRLSRDARIGYLIFNRRITGPNHGWEWESYTGDDPHDTHFHVSSVHGAVADSAVTWQLPGGVVMPELTATQVQMLDDMEWRMDALVSMSATVRGGKRQGDPVALVTALQDIQAALRAPLQIDPDALRADIEAAVSGVVSTAVRAELLKTSLTVA